MSAPLTIKFATDHSAAKAGMQDLAASVVSNMVKVSDALNTGIVANGGYGATFRTLATTVANDAMTVANAGLSTAANTNLSIVATASAVGRAAADTQTASVAMTGALAVARAKASFALGVIRNEASATLDAIRNSPVAIGTIGAAAGLAALVLVLHETAEAAKAAEARIEELVKIAHQAADAGVGTTFLQSLTGQAKDAGLQVDQVTTALQRAREAATTKIGENGHGASSPFEDRLAQHVKAGNLSRSDVERYQGADSQEARIRVVIDLVEQLQKKGAQLAAFDLASHFFGSDFETRLRSGVDMLGMMRKALDGLGAAGGERVISEQEIQRAQALRDRIQEVNNKLAAGMAPIMRDILLYQQQQEGAWLDTKDRIADCIVAAGKLYQSVKDIGSAIGNANVFVQLRDWLDARGLIDHEGVQKLEEQLNGGKALAKLGAPKDGEAQPGEHAPLAITVSPKRDTSRALPKTGSHGSDSDPVDTYIDGLKKSAAALRAEAEAFNKSNAEKAEAIALAKAHEIASANGTKLTDDQTRKVKEAATAASTYKDKLADLEQQQQQAAETARYFGNALSEGFADAILEGRSLGDVLMSLEKQIARSALQALFTGQGSLSGLLGTAPAASAGSSSVGGIAGFFTSMFGGFRANGGAMQAGRAYTVGEMGQELFVPNQDGRMVPIARGGFGGGAGGGVQIIDQRTMAAPAPEVKRGPGGSTQLILRDLEGGLGQRAARGQGPLAGLIGGPESRKG